MTKRPLAILTAVALLVGPAAGVRAADDKVGTGGASFMKLGMGSARAMSLGRAYVAMAEGTDAINWNPAGLALTQTRELSYSYLRYIQDVQAPFFMAYAHPLGRTVIGANAAYMSLSGFEVRDAQGRPLPNENVNVRNGFATMSVARSFLYEKIFLGASLRDVVENNAGANKSTMVMDLGVMFKPNTTSSLAMSLQNLGGDQARVYKVTRIGAAKQLFELMNLSVELSKPSDNGTQLGIGGEFILPEELLSVGQVSMRIGYFTTGNQGQVATESRHSLYPLVGAQGLSFGLGLFTSQAFGYGIGFDYALVPMGALGMSDQMTIRIKF
ncbi:MAG: hypothetical protein HY059_09760 [Proteobacteria bacterium]|nr:hypothetical protein [Pseudomonadota bacterium]